MAKVLFLNVMKHSDTRPVACGVFSSLAQALEHLHCAGVNPGFCGEHPIKDEGGEVVSVLFSTEKYMVTMTLLPYDVAHALATSPPMWAVPDEMEA